ncbi:zinc ribbon domain-containing protein [Halanaerobaculum tunisiense]
MSKIDLLYQLQSLDEQMTEIEEGSGNDSLEEEIASLKEEIEKLKQKKEVTQADLAQVEEKIKEQEFVESRVERQKEDYEKQLYSGENSNPKELEQLKEKLESISLEKEELEENLLELMVQAEEIEEEIKQLEEKIAEQKRELSAVKEKKEEQEEEQVQELESIKERRQEIITSLDEEVLAKYDQLLASKNGKAVVKVEDGYCLGCRMSLPIKLVSKVKANQELILCNSCGRILYCN